MALAVPNFCEGRDSVAIEAVTAAFAAADLLDRHSDEVHDRTVLSLLAPGERIVEALAAGAAACVERIDLGAYDGAHPCIGALDVCPLVWLSEAERDQARELALETAAKIAELGVPVFFYGELAAEPARLERAFFRRGGVRALAGRMRSEELSPDLGPAEPHPTAGATLVTARPPLVAFNVELDTADMAVAAAVAAELRESGGGFAGVRAIAIALSDRVQISTNIHDPVSVSLAAVIERVRELAGARGARPVAGEVVGLVPEAALRELPEEVPLRGFDPERQVLERRIELARGRIY